MISVVTMDPPFMEPNTTRGHTPPTRNELQINLNSAFLDPLLGVGGVRLRVVLGSMIHEMLVAPSQLQLSVAVLHRDASACHADSQHLVREALDLPITVYPSVNLSIRR